MIRQFCDGNIFCCCCCLTLNKGFFLFLFVNSHASIGLLQAETFRTLCETVLDNASHSSLKCLWLSGSKVSKAGCPSYHHLPLLCQGDDPGEGALISACMELRWGHSPVMVGLMCPWETFTVTMQRPWCEKCGE